MIAGIHDNNKRKRDIGRDKLTVLYEDEYLAVIYKPAGILSVSYPGNHAQTARDILERMMRKKGSYSHSHRPFAVHRLDRETSGVMLFALTEKVQKKIMDNWQTLVTERMYRAVAENPARENHAQGNAAHSAAYAMKSRGTIDDGIAYNAHNRGCVPEIYLTAHEQILSGGSRFMHGRLHLSIRLRARV